MDIIAIYRDFLDVYGVWGVVLAALTGVLLLVQLYYYLMRYGRIPKYSNKRQKESIPGAGISVVVILKDDYEYLEKTLPVVMGQDYNLFELVVVYVGANTEFRELLTITADRYPKLTTTRFNEDSRFEISNKMAYNVGIKAARYDNIILTTADATPPGDKWLKIMAKGFSGDTVIIGYCGIEPEKGVANKLMRASRMMMSVRYLAAAITGHPYRGTISNLGFTKSVYFGSKGFNHLNMNLGEDDLYVQRVLTGDNVSVVINPNCTVREKFWGGLEYWRTIRAFYGSALRYYPLRARAYIFTELFSRLLFYVAAVAGMIWFPGELKIAVAGLIVLRLLVVMHVLDRICRRLGEKGLNWTLLLYDPLAPFFELSIWLKRKTEKDRRVWR